MWGSGVVGRMSVCLGLSGVSLLGDICLVSTHGILCGVS